MTATRKNAYVHNVLENNHKNSFGGLPMVGDENDQAMRESYEKAARRKISDISSLIQRPKNCLRKLSLMSIKRNDVPKRIPRDLNDSRLQRSNSLPDTKTLSIMDTNFFSKLKNKRADLTKTRSVTFHLETICLNAAADNDLIELKSIIDENEVDLNYTNGCGQTMCHCAASTGSYETLEFLIDEGADVNTYDERSCTPLDLAIKGGYFDCALLLINAGARVENIVNGVQ